ncbi:MAG TPA: hypothetical protein VG228_02815 [Solirubrobacteraceae bacterium]|nr:hypothetical protein [Solirubrobacteraceae bacterium]
MGISTTFGRNGAVVRAGSGVSLQLGLEAFGRGHSLVGAKPSSPVSRANSVDYRHPGIMESYTNGPLGLEQGFTVARRPAGTGELTLIVGQVLGGAHITVAPGGTELIVRGSGAAVGSLRYAGLSVIDSTRRLPAQIMVAGRDILLRVNDAGATYPLRIDPTVEPTGAALSETDWNENAQNFGHAVAISGDGRTIAVGAPYLYGPPDPSNPQVNYGIVYVFSEPAAGGWANAAQTAELTASDGAAGGTLGVSVAVSGDGGTIVAGAPDHSSDQGAAYVFTRPSSGAWQDATQTAELTETGGSSTASLGTSVAASTDGSTIVAGAPGSTDPASGGAAYVFSEPDGGWQNATQTATLTVSDGVDVNTGASVAISGDGDTIAVGQYGPSSGANAAFVYSEPVSGGWRNTTETADLTVSDPTTESLGANLAIAADGDTIVVGGGYVFTKPANGGWQDMPQTAVLSASGQYGAPTPVAISSNGDTIALGVGTAGTYDGGAADIFDEPAGGGWQDESPTSQVGELDSSYLNATPTQAVAVSGDGGTIVTGLGGVNGEGAAMVFPPLPAASSSPTGSGSAVQGQTLTETNGIWSGNPTGYAHQWEDCDSSGQNCSPIDGATQQSYTLTDGDAGSTVEVQETASNVGGPGIPVSSAPSQVVQPLSATSVPTISGEAVQGKTLIETNASWNTTVTGYVYQWERCHGPDTCSEIVGANDQSYTLTNADAGYTIEVEEDAVNAGGFGIPTISDPTAVVIPLVPTSTQVPVISGTAVEANALSASTLPWTNTPTTISYQWEDCDSAGQNCQAITGATSKTYALAASDIGRRMVVAEAASNAGGTSLPATSAATGAVPESGPVGLQIANGDYATDSPKVTIEAAWPAGTQSILISNNGGFRTDTQTVVPAATINWTLEQTGSDRLPKTVYVRFLGVGQDDINFTDDIILDETAPTIQSATLNGLGAAPASAARAERLKTYKLRLKAKDELVGVCEVATNERRSSNGQDLMRLTSCKARGILKLSRTLKLTLRSKPSYVRVRNSAGDWSRWVPVK